MKKPFFRVTTLLIAASFAGFATSALAEVTTSIPHYWSPASPKYPGYVNKYDQYACNGQAASEGMTIGSARAMSYCAKSIQRSG